MKTIYKTIILSIILLSSCNSALDKTHTITTYYDLSKTASILKEYNVDKIGLLKIELVNNRSHLKPLYLFLKKSEEILNVIESYRNEFQNSYFVESLPLAQKDSFEKISKSSIPKKEQLAFCQSLTKSAHQIDSLINSLLETKLKGLSISNEDCILLKKSLPFVFQIQWINKLTGTLEELVFESNSEEKNLLTLANLKVQIQQAQFSFLSFIDKKAESYHRYSWKNELNYFVTPSKNPIYEGEEFLVEIGISKKIINDIELQVEIEGQNLASEKGQTFFKTKNYQIGRNEVNGRIKYWNPITQKEQHKEIKFYFEVLKQQK